MRLKEETMKRTRTSADRARTAARIYKTAFRHGPGYDWGRQMDEPYESGDGDEVWRLLCRMAADDADLLDALRAESPHSAVEAERIIAARLAREAAQDSLFAQIGA